MAPEVKRSRLLAAAAAILAGADGGCLNTVLLNKALFYFDLASLRDEGDVFTHNTFIALELGPVVSKYATRLIRALDEEGIARQSVDGLAKPISLIARPSAGLGGSLDETARNVARWACGLTSTEASDVSHDNVGWQIARREALKAGKPAAPIDMLLAMQQILGEDPWLDEPFSEANVESIHAADEDRGQPW